MAHAELRERVLDANRAIVGAGLVVLTFGNASAVDRAAGVMAIKPSGVAYDELDAESIVVVDLESGEVVDGDAAAVLGHADAPRPLPALRAVGGIVHTHSPFATAWAQAGRELPCLGTTHADHFRGPVPVTRALTADEIDGDYEERTGDVIVETIERLDARPARRCRPSSSRSHGPFAWGADAAEAVENAIALEAVARSRAAHAAARARRCADRATSCCSRHFPRKHGAARLLRPGRDDEGAPPARRGRPAPRTRSRSRRPARARLLRPRHGGRALRLRPALVRRRAGSATRCSSGRSSSATSSRGVVEAGPRAGERVAVDPAMPCGRCAVCLAGLRAPLPRARLRRPRRDRRRAAVDRSRGRSGSRTRSPTRSPTRRRRCSSRSASRCTRSTSATSGRARPPASSAAARSGCSLVQALRAAGAEIVVATDPLPHRPAAAAALGATYADRPGRARRRSAAAAVSASTSPSRRPATTTPSPTRSPRSGRAAASSSSASRTATGRASRPSAARRKGLTLLLCRRMEPADLPRAIAPRRDGGDVDLASLVSERYPLSRLARRVRGARRAARPQGRGRAADRRSTRERGAVRDRHRLRHRVGPRRARRLRRRPRARRRPSTRTATA